MLDPGYHRICWIAGVLACDLFVTPLGRASVLQPEDRRRSLGRVVLDLGRQGNRSPVIRDMRLRVGVPHCPLIETIGHIGVGFQLAPFYGLRKLRVRRLPKVQGALGDIEEVRHFGIDCPEPAEFLGLLYELGRKLVGLAITYLAALQEGLAAPMLRNFMSP